MRKRINCAVTAAVLAVSLGLSGCSFSVKVGDKEITNRKETTAEESTESTSSASGESHRKVETQAETQPDSSNETTAGYEQGSGGVSADMHMVELTNGCKVYYDGARQLDFDGVKDEFSMATDDMRFKVGTLPNDEAILAAVSVAVALHPEELTGEYAEALKEYISEEVDSLSMIKYIKGYSWLERDASGNINVDCVEYQVEDEGDLLTVVTMFTGSDSNVTLAFNDTCGINTRNIRFEVNGRQFLMSDAKEQNVGKWGARILEAMIFGDSEDISGGGNSGFYTGDTEETTGYSSNNGTFGSVTAPSGWRCTYTSDMSQVFNLTDSYEAEVTLWDAQYYKTDGDIEMQPQTISGKVYRAVTDYYTYYFFPIDSEHYIEVTLDNDANATQSYAEELYKTFNALWVR